MLIFCVSPLKLFSFTFVLLLDRMHQILATPLPSGTYAERSVGIILKELTSGLGVEVLESEFVYADNFFRWNC